MKIEDLRNTGFAPAFDALWHLETLGVVTSLATMESPAWEALAKAEKVRPLRIALLDTPVDLDHPNLVDAIDRALARDFSTDDAGVFVVADLTEAEKAARAELAARAKARETKESSIALALVARIEAEVGPGWPKGHPIQPGAHGTAMAGLIGARPSAVHVVSPDQPSGSADLATGEVDLPYAGVNPFCTIIPISSMRPDPETLEAALVYAELADVDMIVIAADWEDRPLSETDGCWVTVEGLLRNLAQEIPVLCAAGNSGRDALAFPASLADGSSQIYCIEASDPTGKRMDYSAQGHWTLLCLSGQAPRHDRDEVLYDPWARFDPLVGAPVEDPWMKTKGKIQPLPHPFELISTDCRGPLGYNPSPYRMTPQPKEPHLEIHSLFCRFSGTSAATAVAAGLMSLALQSPPQSASEQPKPDVLARPELQTKKIATPKTGGLFDLKAATDLVSSQS